MSERKIVVEDRTKSASERAREFAEGQDERRDFMVSLFRTGLEQQLTEHDVAGTYENVAAIWDALIELLAGQSMNLAIPFSVVASTLGKRMADAGYRVSEEEGAILEPLVDYSNKLTRERMEQVDHVKDAIKDICSECDKRDTCLKKKKGGDEC